MYNREYTPDRISKLNPNEVFVFGSNLEGLHYTGSARLAYEHFGAIWGQGVGLQGKSYAIPIVEDYVEPGIEAFVHFAASHQQYRFLVSRLDYGYPDWPAEDIAYLLVNALQLKNVILPGKYVQVAKEFEHWIVTNGVREQALDNCRYSKGYEYRIGPVYRMKVSVIDGGFDFYVNQYIDFFNDKGQYVYSYGIQFDEEEGWIIDDWTTDRIHVINDVEYVTKNDSTDSSIICTDTYYIRDGYAVIYDDQATINRNAFSRCEIKSIVLPRGLKYIDFYAFGNSLETIIVPVDAADRLTSMLPFWLQDLVVVRKDE